MAEVKEPKVIIEGEVKSVQALQESLDNAAAALSGNEQFRQFLELQKTIPAQIDEAWRKVQALMIDNDIKTLKGEWGWITIAERLGFTIDEEALPRGYKKLVPDTKKIGDHFRLTNKPVKGTTPKTTKYLTKGIK